MAASSLLGVLMKLDKNQRKPRVFKASDLCPYYNRRVYSADNAGCSHIYLSPCFQISMLVSVKQGDLYSQEHTHSNTHILHTERASFEYIDKLMPYLYN